MWAPQVSRAPQALWALRVIVAMLAPWAPQALWARRGLLGLLGLWAPLALWVLRVIAAMWAPLAPLALWARRGLLGLLGLWAPLALWVLRVIVAMWAPLGPLGPLVPFSRCSIMGRLWRASLISSVGALHRSVSSPLCVGTGWWTRGRSVMMGTSGRVMGVMSAASLSALRGAHAPLCALI
jgi:hypothetical protein